MPKVRMLTSVSGPDCAWDEGEVVDMTPEQASVWADGERGEVVRPTDPVQTPERTKNRFQTPEVRHK